MTDPMTPPAARQPGPTPKETGFVTLSFAHVFHMTLDEIAKLPRTKKAKKDALIPGEHVPS